MRVVIFQILILNLLLSSCCQNAETIEVKIKPLHPYSSSPHDHNLNERRDSSYLIKFYFIEGATEATDRLSTQVDSFITEIIKKKDSDFVDYGDYYVKIYRKTRIINESFREKTDGMISHNLLDEYDNDLLFEYVWFNKDFMRCDFYKGGKVFKTVYDKGMKYLRRIPALPLPDSEKVIMKEMPQWKYKLHNYPEL